MNLFELSSSCTKTTRGEDQTLDGLWTGEGEGTRVEGQDGPGAASYRRRCPHPCREGATARRLQCGACSSSASLPRRCAAGGGRWTSPPSACASRRSSRAAGAGACGRWRRWPRRSVLACACVRRVPPPLTPCLLCHRNGARRLSRRRAHCVRVAESALICACVFALAAHRQATDR